MNMEKVLSRFALFAVSLGLFVLGAHSAQAQSVRVLGDHRDWSAYASTSDAGKLCFALSKPKTVQPTPAGYEQSYLYLSHRVAEGVRNEINFVAGFDLDAQAEAAIRVGGEKFVLFVDKGAAWLDNIAQAERVAGAMRAGSTLRVEIVAADGTEVIETFSLSGATAASRSIDRECG